jgi:hypothetical protein
MCWRAKLARCALRSVGWKNSFEPLSRLWRYVGEVHLIEGPDLAAITIQAHTFLDFLSRDLKNHFIDSTAKREMRMGDLNGFSDPDGRYRIQDLFCVAEMWQEVVSDLIKTDTVIVADLRGYSATNKGILFEIQEALQHVPAERLVLLLDDSADTVSLDRMIVQVWNGLPPGSKNAGRNTSVLAVDCRGANRKAIPDGIRAAFVAADSSRQPV